MLELKDFLEKSALEHNHLCPRQVLGVRMGIYAARVLSLDLPQTDKRLFTFIETDGCLVDGVCAATGCTVGHRTMRIMDYGKVAATFVDSVAMTAIRIAPLAQSRQKANEYLPDAPTHWEAQLEAYQFIPDDELLSVQKVELAVSLEKILSKPGLRVNCDRCHEEIMNEREVQVGDQVLCETCAGNGYYKIDGHPRDLIGQCDCVQQLAAQ